MVASNKPLTLQRDAANRPAPLRGPVDESVLQELARRIVGARPDACVMLFGSRARGNHRHDSDVDLMVVTETGECPLRVSGELYAAVGLRDFDMDLVVMTPQRFLERRSRFDPFMHDAIREGRVLVGNLP